MGVSNAVSWFDNVMSLVPKGLIHHYKDLFSASLPDLSFLIRMVFSYLDDFVFAAWHLDFAARQVAAFDIVSKYLGLQTLPSKFEPPATSQTILGVVYSSLLGCVALKDKKPGKIKAILNEFQHKFTWSAEEIESLCGNLIWLSFFLPRIRAFTTPLLIALVIANAAPSKKVNRMSDKNLYDSTSECLRFLIHVMTLDPCNPVYRFLDIYETRRIISFTDASGFEKCIKNPSPGCIAGFFDAPQGMISFAFAIPWDTIRTFLPTQEVFVRPHINYLKLMTPVILFLWLCIFFPKFVRNHRFVIKLDSTVTQ